MTKHSGPAPMETERIYSGKLCPECWERVRKASDLLVNDSFAAIGEGDCTMCKRHTKVRIPLKWMIRRKPRGGTG